MAIACFIFWLFTIDAFFFQFWGCGIRMHICILTRVQKGRVCSWKQGHILLINVLLKINFEHEGHLYADCLFYTPTIYPKCHSFHFFSRGIRMYIPILAGFQNGCRSCLKDSVFLQKNVLFEASFRWWRSLVCHLLVLHSDYLS